MDPVVTLHASEKQPDSQVGPIQGPAERCPAKSPGGKEGSPRHILILTHRQDKFEETGYLLNEMVKIWREEGFYVAIQSGPKIQAEADVVILHVDLTVIPDEYVAAIRPYPWVINGRVVDISKRLISKNIIRRGDGCVEPVIVKTNKNCGGAPDAGFVRQQGGIQKLGARLRRRLPWSLRSELSSYPILPTARHVPAAVWLNRDLVVERFLPERRGEFYCLRTWVFFGDRETNSISYSHVPVVKLNNIVRRESVAEVPDELRRIRKDLGFDFGKFDYGIVNGKVVLYDANSTPTWRADSGEFQARARLLAAGISTLAP